MAMDTGKIVSWVALVISILALVISVFQWREAVAQNRETAAQNARALMPSVGFFEDVGSGDSDIGIQLTNSGPGVALIKSVKFYVDGRLVRDVDVALANGGFDDGLSKGVAFSSEDSMAVGESDWLIDYLASDVQLDRLESFMDDRLNIDVEYCSVEGDHCRHKCSASKCPAL